MTEGTEKHGPTVVGGGRVSAEVLLHHRSQNGKTPKTVNL